MKISPTIEFDKQVFYLRKLRKPIVKLRLYQKTHASSPLGLVIHSNKPVQVDEKDLRLAFQPMGREKEEASKNPSGKSGSANPSSTLVNDQY